MSDSGSVLADRLLIFIDKHPGVVIAIHTRICFADIFCHWGQLRALLSTAPSTGRHAGAPERWFTDDTNTNVTNDVLTCADSGIKVFKARWLMSSAQTSPTAQHPAARTVTLVLRVLAGAGCCSGCLSQGRTALQSS